MRIHSRFLNWGVFFILLGAIPLAVRAGVLTSDQVASWWSLWPLIIVGIGIGLILSRTALEFLGGLIVASTFGLMAGALFAGGGLGFPGNVCGNEAGTTPIEARSGRFAGPAEVDVEFDCGSLDVRAVEGDSWAFSGSGEPESQPRVESSEDALTIRSRAEGVRFAFVGRRERWDLELPTGIPYALDVQLNAGEARLDPGAAQLREVHLQFNAASAVLDLGSVVALGNLDLQGNAGSAEVTLPGTSFDGRVQVNAGSVALCAPAGAALRLATGDNPIGSYDLDGAGLERSGDTWTSPGYDTAAIRIDLDLEANVGSISLNPEDGCDG